MRERLMHALSGNDTPPEATALTRGIVASALIEIAYLGMRIGGVSETLMADVLSHIGATVTLMSFLLYGYIDSWLMRTGRK